MAGAQPPPDPRLDPVCRKISERGLFQVAQNDHHRGLLIHRKTHERHVVENFKDLHCHDGRAFMRLRNGEKKWLDRLFSWSLWLSENEKEFVMKSGDNGKHPGLAGRVRQEAVHIASPSRGRVSAAFPEASHLFAWTLRNYDLYWVTCDPEH